MTADDFMDYFFPTATQLAVGIDPLKTEKVAQSQLSRLFLCLYVKLLCYERLCGRAAKLAALTFSSGRINPTQLCHSLLDPKDDSLKLEKGNFADAKLCPFHWQQSVQ